VKRFFRKAAEADKPVIVVFNQCDLDDDRPIWPSWLATFTSETGVQPALVYVVPYDRNAARDMQLPFYVVGPEGKSPPQGPADLRAELGALHFNEIKLRTFRGALEGVLARETGAAHWLDQVRAASGGFAAAARSLSATEMAHVNWPVVPPSILVDEIRHWWDDHRSPWSRSVNGFYSRTIRGVLKPIQAARAALGHEPHDPLVAFHAQERTAILEAIGHLIGQLERLAQVGNEMLRPRLAALLAGERRGQLLERVERAHNELPAVGEAFRAYLRNELNDWGQENPRAIGFLRSLDHAAAIARPAITVTLAVSGGLFSVGVVAPAATHMAGQTVGHLAAEAAITGGITVGGEAMVSATGEGLKQTSARLFRRLQTRYTELRATWLAEWLERELLGELLAELHSGAVVAESAAMRASEESLAALAGKEVVGSR